MRELILGSGSPRRAALLSQIGLHFRVLVGRFDETIMAGEDALDYIERMSRGKTGVIRSMIGSAADKVVLCADTIVLRDDQILGKPVDEEAAVSMLVSLSGRSHRVLTSVSITSGTDETTFRSETIVNFRRLTEHECRNYWATGEAADKAGAYGIQGMGAVLVESIHGSYSNVVGLPLTETALTLRAYGIDCLAPADSSHALEQNYD